MDELEQLRSSADMLLAKAQSGTSLADLASAVEIATAVQRLLIDLESSRAALRKTELEEEKLQHENATAAARERSERLKSYVTLLAPLITVITLAATLLAQNYQFVRSEKDKNQAALDAQWQDAVKSISQANQLPPALVTLQPFLNSPEYTDRAKLFAVQLAVNSHDETFFDDLMGIAFVPSNWSNLDDLLKINRGLSNKSLPIYAKTYNANLRSNDPSKLTPDEQAAYNYFQNVFPKNTVQIGSVLKLKRPQGVQPDLSNGDFTQGDWSGVDLSSTVIENATFINMDLKNANLSQITRFKNVTFINTAWWEAQTINRDLLTYLQAQYPCDSDSKNGYGPGGYKHFTKTQCETELSRLQKASGL